MHCTEFVQLLSSEANEVSTREKKSTIQPDHVIKALQELGFAEFLEEVTAAWEGHKEESKSKLLSLSAPGGVRHQGRACRRCQQGEGKVTVMSLRKVLLPTGLWSLLSVAQRRIRTRLLCARRGLIKQA